MSANIIDNFISPSKHRLIVYSDEENCYLDNDEGLNYQKDKQKLKRRLSAKLSKILIENTPTPLINNKFKTNNIALNDKSCTKSSTNNLFSNRTNNNNRRMIPNTPINVSNMNSTKKMKKLLNINRFDDLEFYNENEANNFNNYDENFLSKNHLAPTVNTKLSSKSIMPKMSNIFKPKSSLGTHRQDQEEENGSDLSFESLQKRQRSRKNQLIVRKSDIFKNIQKNKNHNEDASSLPPVPPAPANYESNKNEQDNLPKIDINSLNYKNQIEFSVDPIDINGINNLNSTQSNPNKQITISEISCTPILTHNSLISACSASNIVIKHLNDENYQDYNENYIENSTSTFTKITKNNVEDSIENEIYDDDVSTSLFSNIVVDKHKNQDSTNASKHVEINETNLDEDLDFILFNGIKLNDDSNQNDSLIFSKKLNPKKKQQTAFSNCLNDKTNFLTSNYNENLMIFNEKMNNFRYCNDEGSAKNEIKKFKERIIRKKIKTKKFNIAFLNISPQQQTKLKRIVDCLMENETTNHVNEKIKVNLNEKYNFQTSHFILDFQEMFESRSSDNNGLTTINIFLTILAILNKCKIVRHEWLFHCYNKNKWLKEDEYLLDAYVGDDLYDLEQQDQFDIKLAKLIKKCDDSSFNRKLFTSFRNVYILNYDKQNGLYDDKNQSIFKEFFSQISNRNNMIDDILIEIINKLGAHITSRVTCSQMIIAIDKTYDYDENCQDDKEKIELDKLNFKKSIENCRYLLRKKAGIEVISSNWLLNSILENYLLDKSEYVLDFIYPYRNNNQNYD